MDTAVPAASSDGEAIFDPEDNLDSDFCNALVDSPKMRAAMDDPLFVLIIIITPSFEFFLIYFLVWLITQ
jgi:hypothetical protein